MTNMNQGETKKVTFSHEGTEHAFLVTPFEMSPGRWRTHVTRLDGTDLEMVPGGQQDVPISEDAAVGVATTHLHDAYPGAQAFTVAPHFG